MHQGIAARLSALAGHPLLAYGTIVLLQLQVMRGIWKSRDMTTGDECFWLTTAWRWFHDWRVDIAWSPIYSLFYGSFFHFTNDAARAMFLHRVAIAVLASVMVLAVMRRLLPVPAAWIVTAWWAVLPINFDTMYEVHLFAVLPLLASWLIVMAGESPWFRGAAMGVLLLDALLIRNETIVTAGVFAVLCAGCEVKRHRRLGRSLALPYAAPLVFVLTVVAGVHARSSKRFPELWGYWELKHTVNMGQAYAAGYKQRHPEWTGDRWTQYGEICQRDFGTQSPTFWQMLRRNPRAAGKHVLWNLSLVPNGLQLMLFNGVAGARDPDYPGTFLRRRFPIPLALLTLVIVGGGAITLRRDWRQWIGPNNLGWLTMGCAVPAAVLVMAIERPRPAYLFGLSLLLMAVVGLCGSALASRLRWGKTLSSFVAPMMVLAPLLVPSYYDLAGHGRPVLESYERLRPYESLLARPGAAFVGSNPQAVQAFVGHGVPDCFDYRMLDEIPAGMGLSAFLNARHITVFELDPQQFVRLQSERPQLLRDFLADAPGETWHLVALRQSRRGPWMLFSREGGPGPIMMQ